MPIDTTVPLCLHCGTGTETHHAECPRPLDRELYRDAYEYRANFYARLRTDQMPSWVLEPAPAEDPPGPPPTAGMFGIDRTTDPISLAGHRMSPTMESSARILRELYPDGGIRASVYDEAPGGIAMAMADESRRAMRRARQDLGAFPFWPQVGRSSSFAEPGNPEFTVSGQLAPHLLASAEAEILRKMHGGQTK